MFISFYCYPRTLDEITIFVNTKPTHKRTIPPKPYTNKLVRMPQELVHSPKKRKLL